MGDTYGDQFASVAALCQLGIECSTVNLALVEFDRLMTSNAAF
jgi:hypothetical protein